jgi:urease accessory protein
MLGWRRESEDKSAGATGGLILAKTTESAREPHVTPIRPFAMFLPSARAFLPAILLALAPSLVQAHPGSHEDGVVAGVLHPLTGADHLLAMIAVGLWAASLGGRARLLVPAAFVGVMILGALCGAQGIAVPGVETATAMSVVVLGLAAALRLPLPTSKAVTLVALFAAVHGYAHGIEMPAMADPLAYGFGFAAVTALLHVAGLGIGLASRSVMPARLAGSAIAVAGVALVLAG